MKFQYRYFGNSQVNDSATATSMQFAPDTLRTPTYFAATLQPSLALAYREGISALHDVVVSDLRTQPKDRTAYFAWLAENEASLLADFMAQEKELSARVKLLRSELTKVQEEKFRLMQPFYKAQRAYFDYLYKENRDMWIVLDPVITVHPDKVFFECFSRDESTYASLSCRHDVFRHLGEFSCGTTNIDYSEDLYQEFQKIRAYKETRFEIQADGFKVQTGKDDQYHEAKIDLPDSWMRGFLQVSTAMSLPAHRLTLHPMDVHSICHVLRRKTERVGPRSIRFILEPGQPVQMLFEPWGVKLVCQRSIFTGKNAAEVRIWGRRRLLTLERLIAVADSFSVMLMGTGLPSFWIAHLPDMDYTLGLSGWTANDWSRAGQFDLLAPRLDVDAATSQAVAHALSTRWSASTDNLAQQLQIDSKLVASALTGLMQAGRVVYDAADDVARWRDLVREPIDVASLRFASERESLAARLVHKNLLLDLQSARIADGGMEWQASVSANMENTKKLRKTMIRLDNDDRLVDGLCSCDFYVRNRMFRGPCEHMLAVRQVANGK
ncbi:SWIM zinc finger family protein [Undibacterium sp. TS12]|uniref:SWIM zinc finger family protein n=1 Tax=Undibacterium sp. TS12 TaxID=2908202 RepID=UPI001F4C749D|nr:SWIM zinc finger family protein [Undibacterium sp. TS12]MCH8619558.1 SWIM zinc finger family protein [Undibacterium sp. TS12]